MTDFNYHYRTKPPIIVPCDVKEYHCIRCGAPFQTKCRRKRRCDTCQAIVRETRIRKRAQEVRPR